MNDLSFWRWLIRGSGSTPGLRRFLDLWAFLHFNIGVVLAWAVKIDLSTCASSVLLPLAGILVGLSFAWAGNAQALLQSAEIEELSKHHPGGYVEYVFTYQLAILAILFTMVSWGLAGLRVFDDKWPTGAHPLQYFVLKAFLFAISSLTLRECWQIVLSAQWMLILRKRIKSRGEPDKS
jgi:hypothetical protein